MKSKTKKQVKGINNSNEKLLLSDVIDMLLILDEHCTILIRENEKSKEKWVRPFISGVRSVHGRILMELSRVRNQ